MDKKNDMQVQKNLNPHIVQRQIDPELTIPTFFEDNEFTFAPQQVIDQYDTPKFKEANPGVFTAITFPFLFGMMFGDVFAGSMLMSFGIYLMMATPTKGSIVEQMYQGRYFLFLMGFFSLFCGLCYNDFTSLPLYLFGRSCYTYEEGKEDPTLDPECVYPFGVDPSWYLSSHEIAFINSLKMKTAVIYGVAQMSLGIFLKGTNALYYKQPVDFLFEFLPQFVMMLALFGFMDFLIVLKWLTDLSDNTAAAPSIITMTIDMAMTFGEPTVAAWEPLIQPQAKQTKVMQICMMIVAVCVPLMLCVKPCFVVCTGANHPKVEEEDEIVGGDYAISDNYQRASLLEEKPNQLLTKKDDAFNVRENLIPSLGIEPERHHEAIEIFIH